MDNRGVEDFGVERIWKHKLYVIIFRSDTFAGRLFDEILLGLIVFSIGVVMLESVNEIRSQYGSWLLGLEWGLTLLFTLEYLLRIYCSPKRMGYVFSFLGIIDLLAILPTLLSAFFPLGQTLLMVRAIRLLRIYRILKLYHFVREGNRLILALKNSFRKILIFMFFVLILVLLLGSIMYVVEGGKNGFYSIPLSIYWAVITLTTVGYGDIVPVTGLGKFIATFIMLLGYSIIAIPTGLVSVELTRTVMHVRKSVVCQQCQERVHDHDARFCKRCGAVLPEQTTV